MSKNELQIPLMRDSLIHYLNKLSDLELQRTAWAKNPGVEGTNMTTSISP